MLYVIRSICIYELNIIGSKKTASAGTGWTAYAGF